MYGGLGNSNENIKMFLQPFHRNYQIWIVSDQQPRKKYPKYDEHNSSKDK